jgi:hypothetical protein
MGGGAFGPTQYGAPTTPSNQKFINNPGQYQAFNQTPLMNMATANTNAEIGNQQRQSASAYNANGAGGSSGAAAAQRDIAAQGQNAVAGQNLNAAENSFNQQLAQEGANNNFNTTEQGLQNNQYGTQAALYNQQTANRQAAMDQLPGGQYINLFGSGGGY